LVLFIQPLDNRNEQFTFMHALSHRYCRFLLSPFDTATTQPQPHHCRFLLSPLPQQHNHNLITFINRQRQRWRLNARTRHQTRTTAPKERRTKRTAPAASAAVRLAKEQPPSFLLLLLPPSQRSPRPRREPSSVCAILDSTLTTLLSLPGLIVQTF
jgi:hypothetical protein